MPSERKNEKGLSSKDARRQQENESQSLRDGTVSPNERSLREMLCKYLEAVAASIDKGVPLPIYLEHRSLTWLYVDPDVYPWATNPRSQSAQRLPPGKRINQRVAWEKVFQKPLCADRPWRFVILGKRGQGKSLLLRIQGVRLARKALKMLRDPSCAIGEIPIPVVARLGDITTSNLPVNDSDDTAVYHLLERMMRQANRGALDLKGVVDYVLRLAAPRQLWLFLDGLDEVTDRSTLQRRLAMLARLDCHVLISSQLHAYQAIPLPFRTRPFTLAPFSRKQITHFVEKWYRRKYDIKRMIALLNAARVFDYMASNPYLLTWLCWSSDKRRLSSSITRSQVYEQVLRDILGLPADAVALPDGQRASVCMPVLGEIAWQSCWERPRGLMDTDWLLGCLESSRVCPILDGRGANKTRLSPWQLAECLVEDFRRTGLLVPANAERTAYFFPHESIVDYLAARSLADALEGRRTIKMKLHNSESIECGSEEAWRVLDELAWSPRWEEVVIFVAGRLRDPSPLLRMLSDPSQDDHFRHRLALAVLCLGEIPSETLAKHTDLAKTILEVFFQRWWHTLLHGEVRAYRIRNYQRAIRMAAYLDSGATRTGLLASVATKLLDPSPVIRRGAIHTARFIGPPACVPAILDGLASNLEGESMGFTATAIAHLGADAVRTDIVEGLLGGLGKGRQQHAIANALAALGQTEAKSKMVKVLKKGLHAPTNKQLWQAAEALGRVDLKVIINYILGRIRSALRPGSNQRMALKTTYTLLEPGFRKMAQEVCAANQVDHKAMDAAKPFQPLLDHANEYLRVVAAWVLEVTGLADEIAGFDDAILKLLKSDVLAIRLLSLDVIGMRGRLLKRPDAAVLLLDLAMAGRFALPRIRDAVSRFGSTAILRAWPKYWANLASDLTRPWLAKAIEILKNCKNAVGTKDVLRCLVGILQPRDPPVPEHLLTEGLQVVSRLGATANQRTVIECLINLTAHEDPGIRALSAKALGTIRVDSSLPGVSDALRRLVIDENVAVRRAATVAANRIDPKLAQQNLVEAQWVPAGSKAANRKLSQIVGRLAPGAVTPEILQQMMTAPRKRPGEIPSSWRGIARLMDQGLRIFQQAEDEHGRRWLSRTVDALSRVGAELLEGPADSSRQPAAEEGKLALREPHKQMVIAYRLAIVQGRPQAEIAAEISKLRKKRTSQGTISRWIARVVEWIKAGNVLPDMPGRSGRPRSIDPKVIDMGARQDSRTPRQRGKRKDEDE